MPELDTVTTETTQTEQTQQATPVQGNPDAEAARRALYEKHYGATPQEDNANTEQTVTSTGSTAQVEQNSQNPVPPVVATVPPELLDTLKAMQQEIIALRQAQVKPVLDANTEHAPEPSWITALKEGRIEDAEKLLADVAAKRNQESIVEAAVARAREVARAESEIESFVKDVRGANTDIADMEELVTFRAQQALEGVKASGKIKTTEDAIREYKRAVLDATDYARKVAQKLRGSGKQEAMTRNQEVLSATTLNPQQITSTREPQQNSQGSAEPESIENYFEKRKQAEAARKGLG